MQINDFRGARVAALSADEYEEIFTMRVGLEGLAARLGAERIDDETLERVTAQFAELEAAAEADDVDAFIEADREFHRLHYLASGRPGLWKRVIGLRTAAERYTRLGYQLPKVGMRETVTAHRRLLKAVAKRDGARAEAELVKDLNRTFRVVHAKLVADEQRAREAAA